MARARTTISLERVRFIPKELQPGVLYVAEEFGAAAHLCACGCGSRVRTPLGPTDWSLIVTDAGPSLFPSIGNWQQACQSHYWIRDGAIEWSTQWTPEQIHAGRQAEQERSRAYYDALAEPAAPPRWFVRVWRWIKRVVLRQDN